MSVFLRVDVHTVGVDEEPFASRDIEVEVQNWTPTWRDGNVCALDVLFGASDPGRFIRFEAVQ